MELHVEHYNSLLNSEINLSLQDSIFISDHLGGFNKELTCKILESLNEQNFTKDIYTLYCVTDCLKKKYPNIKFSVDKQYKMNLCHFENYNMHPEINLKNFVCSFNGSNHISRQLLASTLYKFNYFNENYCSKNNTNSGSNIDNYVSWYVHNAQFYLKFFDCTNDFNKQIVSFAYERFDHNKNIYTLAQKLTESFLHIVSETMADSYYPFVTEKFLYSVVNRGLFLTYAQPGWHKIIESNYGFRLYKNLFDYRFDSIINPIERLIELMCMISNFSKLTTDEWHDLYLLESDSIEYNYDHYFSKSYLKSLKTIDNTSTI